MSIYTPAVLSLEVTILTRWYNSCTIWCNLSCSIGWNIWGIKDISKGVLAGDRSYASGFLVAGRMSVSVVDDCGTVLNFRHLLLGLIRDNGARQ